MNSRSEYAANRELRKGVPETLKAWRVQCGAFSSLYYTPYHAEQMADALRRHPPLKGVPVTVEQITAPNDTLIRLTA